MERMAWLVESHQDMHLSEGAPFSEREAVFLADKFICGSRFVPIMEWYGQKCRLHASDVEERRALWEYRLRALAVLERFERASGRSASAVARDALSAAMPGITLS